MKQSEFKNLAVNSKAERANRNAWRNTFLAVVWLIGAIVFWFYTLNVKSSGASTGGVELMIPLCLFFWLGNECKVAYWLGVEDTGKEISFYYHAGYFLKMVGYGYFFIVLAATMTNKLDPVFEKILGL